MVGGGDGVVGGGRRWIDNVCPGFRFQPTDEELLSHYLQRRVEGKPLPFGLDEVIPTLRLCGPSADPRHLFEGLPPSVRHSPVQTPEELYAFTHWEHRNGKSGGSHPIRTAGPGTWVSNSKKTILDAHGSVMGYVANLTYHERHGGRKAPTTHWVMQEYMLPHHDDDTTTAGRLVLCRIHYTKGGDVRGKRPPQGRPCLEEEGDDDVHLASSSSVSNKKGPPFLDEEFDDHRVVPVPTEEEKLYDVPKTVMMEDVPPSTPSDRMLEDVDTFDGQLCDLPDDSFQDFLGLLIQGSTGAVEMELPPDELVYMWGGDDRPPQGPCLEGEGDDVHNINEEFDDHRVVQVPTVLMEDVPPSTPSDRMLDDDTFDGLGDLVGLPNTDNSFDLQPDDDSFHDYTTGAVEMELPPDELVYM